MWMWSTGINRNIVECKDTCLHAPMGDFHSINRNIVECKVVDGDMKIKLNMVLIETLWNVKDIHRYVYDCIEIVLIETLWNVKLDTRSSDTALYLRINRNIVECKES